VSNCESRARELSGWAYLGYHERIGPGTRATASVSATVSPGRSGHLGHGSGHRCWVDDRCRATWPEPLLQRYRLWIRRVLVRAQEGHAHREQRWASYLGLGLQLQPRRGSEARQRLTCCRATSICPSAVVVHLQPTPGPAAFPELPSPGASMRHQTKVAEGGSVNPSHCSGFSPTSRASSARTCSIRGRRDGSGSERSAR
jgi:hypothetical protein